MRLALAIAAGLVWWFAHKSAHASTPRTIVIHAKQFAFDPSEVTVTRGQLVRFVLMSDDVPHGLSMEGLPIHAELVKGYPRTFAVTPGTVGDFFGRCTRFCGVAHGEMHLEVHVVEGSR